MRLAGLKAVRIRIKRNTDGFCREKEEREREILQRMYVCALVHVCVCMCVRVRVCVRAYAHIRWMRKFAWLCMCALHMTAHKCMQHRNHDKLEGANGDRLTRENFNTERMIFSNNCRVLIAANSNT